MKKTLAKDEYARLEDEYVREQLKTANPKPIGMFGTWAWHVMAKRRFAKMMKEQGAKIVSDESQS